MKEAIVITWPSEPEQRSPKAEVTWQQPSRTSSWSTWPPLQCLTQPSSYLELWFLLILRIWPPTWLLTVYVVKRYFRLWELSMLRPLVEEWSYHFSSVTEWREFWVVGWMQLSSLLPCVDVSLVIGIGQGYWLDDEGLPLVYHWYWSGLLAWWQRSIFGISSGRW